MSGRGSRSAYFISHHGAINRSSLHRASAELNLARWEETLRKNEDKIKMIEREIAELRIKLADNKIPSSVLGLTEAVKRKKIFIQNILRFNKTLNKKIKNAKRIISNTPYL